MVYEIDALDLKALFGPVAVATAALSRLDERLARSLMRDGWVERQHFADAAAALWLEGELVHAEDLVLHDAHMDIRMPTHELTRAHTVLRTRRQLCGHDLGWALSAEGLRVLTRRGRGEEGMAVAILPPAIGSGQAQEGSGPGRLHSGEGEAGAEFGDPLDAALAAMDATLGRSQAMIDKASRLPPFERPPIAGHGEGAPQTFNTAVRGRPAAKDSAGKDLVYDPEWDEDARLAAWLRAVAETRTLPAVLRAAILIDAWSELDVLQRAAWLGPLLAAASLRQDGLTGNFLVSWSVGARQIPRERRRAFDRTRRLIAVIDAMHQAAVLGLKEHDRQMQSLLQMERRLKGKRRNSKLPDLIGFVLSRPLITAPLVAKELKVSLQGALNLISELGLREVTGRGRFRAWGIF